MDTNPALEIFRAGRHVDMHGRAFDFTRADLADIASRYDPAKHEAPLVIGHPQLNAPAYGWVKGLRVAGDTLVADTHQVDPAFADVVNAGRWKKRSANFLMPDAPDNPVPGQYYLNHVGFLGAQTPAVKGLRDAQFAAADQCVEFASDRRWGFRDVAAVFRRLRDWLVEREGVEAADAAIPSWQIDSLVEAAQPDSELAANPVPEAAFAAPVSQEIAVSESQTAEFAAREQKLTQQAADLVQREQAIAAREQEARRTDAAAFAAELVQSGQLLPRQGQTVVELLLVLPEDAPLSFAADDGTTTTVKPADALRELLAGLPAQVDYAEKSRGTPTTTAASFAAPQGESVDPGRHASHQKAVAYMQQNPGTTYLAAVKAVGG